MRALLLLLLLAACRPPQVEARLQFLRDGKEVATVALGTLSATSAPVKLRIYDPYYNKDKSFRALPLAPLLVRIFGAQIAALREEEFVLRASDGYTVPLSGARLLEPGAHLAVADLEVPGWEPIGPGQQHPGPVYLVWAGRDQTDLVAYPRPWQLAAIEIARFATLFPRTVPAGTSAGAPAMRGFAIFRRACLRCHAMNRQGGRVGPELNLPQSIIEYRPEAQIRAYVRDPQIFRYGNMPSHKELSDKDLDDLIAYFRAMKDRKQDGGP